LIVHLLSLSHTHTHVHSLSLSLPPQGKWHLGQRPQFLPTQRGFDEYFGLPYSVDMGCPLQPHGGGCTDEDLLMLHCPPLPLLNQSDIIQQPVDLSTLAPQYAQWGRDFIARHEGDEEPYFLYVPFNHVHVSVQEGRQYASKQFWNSSKQGHFGDALAELDWLTGEVMQAVRGSAHANNTLVFWTSDNGPWLPFEENAGSVGPFRGEYAYEAFGYTDTGKGTTWEGGIRMPFAVWGKGTCAGCYTSEAVSNMDIFSTALDFAGVQLTSALFPEGHDG
jgi:arylsulfatase A